MNPQTVLLLLKLMDLAVFAAGNAGPALERYKAGRDRVRKIVEEGRDPTPEEFAEMDQMIQTAGEQLHQPLSLG